MLQTPSIAVKLMRGKPQTPIVLTVMREERLRRN